MFDIKQTMKEIILQDENLALPVVTVKALVEFTRNSRAKTYAEYLQNLNEQTDLLKKPGNPISYHAGIDLFISFVAKLPFTAFDSFKRDIIHGAELMIDQCEAFRNVCADNGIAFIKDNSSILIHSYSRLVLLLLLKASKTKHFQVYVTSASPRNSGIQAMRELRSNGIPCALISDASIGYYMNKIEMVLVGAEGVVRNGGIINQIGTNPIAIVAKQLNKPFYCIAESYKFVNVFPLNQDDLDFTLDYTSFTDDDDYHQVLPKTDYTPPEFVTMFFTNEGVLTAPGVSELFLKSN